MLFSMDVHLIIWFSFLVHVQATALAVKVLIFGGNGMLGSSAVSKLVANGIHCTLVSRGNWYWDSGIRIKPFVNHIKCERTNDIAYSCPSLFQDGNQYDAIIDFSSYYPEDLKAVLKAFKGTIKRYIFISSDSVYEVCAPKNHTGFSKEEDAVRPVSINERVELGRRDSYGDRKLTCEEVLSSYGSKDGFDYVSLRLPDVIGPRDNTGRLWPFYLSIFAAAYMSRAIEVGSSVSHAQVSLVYSEDVANLISRLLSMPSKVFNTSYNLAFLSTGTVEEFIGAIAKEMGVNDVVLKLINTDGSTLGIPSVTRGPINIDRAVKYLQWNPTSFDAAVYDIVTFYQNAVVEMKYRDNLHESLRRLDLSVNDFLSIFDKVYRVGTKRPIDEL